MIFHKNTWMVFNFSTWFSSSCLGAVVVLMTSTLNRLMAVELSMAATVPGFLVGLHYAVQLSRPKWGLISDLENNRTKWINLGMLILGIGANLATLSLVLFHSNSFSNAAFYSCLYTYWTRVGASGTSLLALMAKHTAERRRPAAASDYMVNDDIWDSDDSWNRWTSCWFHIALNYCSKL